MKQFWRHQIALDAGFPFDARFTPYAVVLPDQPGAATFIPGFPIWDFERGLVTSTPSARISFAGRKA
jgi:hypothetical protein